MIHIEDLTQEDKGRYVIYTDGTGEKQRGRITGWNDKWIFVVYHCAGEWDNYKDYTGVATSSNDLKFAELKDEENEIDSRFDILDL